MTTENPIPNEKLAIENQAIFAQIRGLIPSEKIHVTYRSPIVESHQAFLEQYEGLDAFIDEFELPEKFNKQFTLPIVVFADDDEDFQPVTTPYGILSRFAVAQDGSLYLFSNIYFFDKTGVAKKYESIRDTHDGKANVDETITGYFGITRQEALESGLRILDFDPDPVDGRLMDLENGDYEKIHSILTQIVRGEWRLITHPLNSP